jgi:hypothetical protein
MERGGMNWSFCIATNPGPGVHDRLQKVVDSIWDQYQRDAEIIICGNSHVQADKVANFDESVKPGWITRKKNSMVEVASNENLCILHDYYILNDGFRDGFERFGDDWDLAMCKIFNFDGVSRYRDWCAWQDPRYGSPWIQREPFAPNGIMVQGEAFLPPYEYNSNGKNTRYMYISGGFYIAKKSFMKKFPFDESLSWGQGEDCEHALRWANYPLTRYKMNVNSSVRLAKPKDVILKEVNII